MSYQFITQATLPTAHGLFDIHVFEDTDDTARDALGNRKHEHVMLTVGLPTADKSKIPLVRIHSECLTGDAFSSLKCDCGPQLNATMQMIQAYAKNGGCGAILYLRQEGRGIGLNNKIRAYALQDQGHDTLDANLLLDLPADARTYEMCKPMLEHVGVDKVKLITNNPNKLEYLNEIGIEVVARVPLLVGVNPHNEAYLNTKKERMGHMIENGL